MEIPEVARFFDERKEAWLKKNQKASMSEEEVFELKLKCEEIFRLENWLPDAAKRAGQISVASHPCTFSHPSARKNKNGYVSSIIAGNIFRKDGLLRSGNVKLKNDALGNAAALDVHKFLHLELEDNRLLLEHIVTDSIEVRSLLNVKGTSYDTLKQNFLKMIENSSEEITSSKIKQVYFPVEEDYHQLSLLTNSGMLYELKKRIDTIRFGEEFKEVKESKKKNEFSEDTFCDLYDLTTIGYGGTKPQNISVLNSKNGGKAHLLHSMPPSLETRDIHFPKRNFFGETLKIWELKEIFHALQSIFKTDYNNVTIREGRDYRYQQLVDKMIQKMWLGRAVSKEQYYEKNSLLKSHQKVWLCHEFSEQREIEDKWLDTLITESVNWFIKSYEKSFGNKAVKFGHEERLKLLEIVEKNREALR